MNPGLSFARILVAGLVALLLWAFTRAEAAA